MTESENDEVDSHLEGFRDPADLITEPCLTYMSRIMELRRFIGFYFQFVKNSQNLAQLIPKETIEKIDPKARQVLEYNYSEQRPLVNQIMVSRAVESFDLYLTTILKDIFLARPDILKSAGTIEISTIIETGNYEDLIWQIVERKIHELSYKPLTELRRFIESRTGIDPFPSNDVFNIVILASEVRNLIAHNDCIVNDLFKSRIKDIQSPLAISTTGRLVIDDEWLRRTSYTIDSLVFRFDELAAAKFNLRTLNRMGAFLLRD